MCSGYWSCPEVQVAVPALISISFEEVLTYKILLEGREILGSPDNVIGQVDIRSGELPVVEFTITSHNSIAKVYDMRQLVQHPFADCFDVSHDLTPGRLWGEQP